jgi:hypothetical protein
MGPPQPLLVLLPGDGARPPASQGVVGEAAGAGETPAAAQMVPV